MLVVGVLQTLAPEQTCVHGWKAAHFTIKGGHDDGALPSLRLTDSKTLKDFGATCDGTTDDNLAVAAALHAAAGDAFTLLVDCPAFIHIGSDIAKTVFIESGTTVVFSGDGKFIADNVYMPAFAILHQHNITFTNMRLEYNSRFPADAYGAKGYYRNGTFVSDAGYTPAAGHWNDYSLTPWLAKHCGIIFTQDTALWDGPTDTSAVFFIKGDSSNVVFTGLKAGVPDTAGGDSFIPVLFALMNGYLGNQTVNRSTPFTHQYVGVPHHFTFNDVELDGTYMTFQGNCRHCVFSNIVSKRYGDIQDKDGYHVGGYDGRNPGCHSGRCKWFAPPHLFYLNYAEGDPELYNYNITIANVRDIGPRIGTARDKTVGKNQSGNALSLKLGCVNCSVTNYSSSRPDGFNDVLTSSGLTVTNVTASFDSEFLNGVYPGWRWPGRGYHDITYRNVTLIDVAASAAHHPMDGATCTAAKCGETDQNSNIVFNDVTLVVKAWGDLQNPENFLSIVQPVVNQGANSVRTYRIASTDGFIVSAFNRSVGIDFGVLSASGTSGSSTKLYWAPNMIGSSSAMPSCAASGAWGVLPDVSPANITHPVAGTFEYTITCKTARHGDSVSATVTVTIK